MLAPFYQYFEKKVETGQNIKRTLILGYNAKKNWSKTIVVLYSYGVLYQTFVYIIRLRHKILFWLCLIIPFQWWEKPVLSQILGYLDQNSDSDRLLPRVADRTFM